MSPVIRANYPTVAAVEYQIDYISGSTAYLYPYTDRADSPRTVEKVVTVAASSITERIQIANPSGAATTADFPQLTDGNAYGYMDLTLTRSGTAGGTVATYHEIDTNNRWELNCSTATNAAFRIQERVAGSVTIRLTVNSQITTGAVQFGVRMDANGHTAYRAGTLIGNYATVGSVASEPTAKAAATSGLAVTNIFLYPLRITR